MGQSFSGSSRVLFSVRRPTSCLPGITLSVSAGMFRVWSGGPSMCLPVIAYCWATLRAKPPSVC